ncbi:MAG: hypothetical protein JWM80_4128, partial [Cyanobacteria bacterium RYN_339]|nr:hypothetical protein [Cyanobacteria bacterium RYN_339]
VGKRAYDPRSGRFSLTLTAPETVKLMASAEIDEARARLRKDHLVRVVAVDDRGEEAVGYFDPPKDGMSITRVTSRVGFTDPYGRFVERDYDQAQSKQANRAAGRVLTLVGPEVGVTAPLTLRLARRFQVELPGQPGLDTRTVLTPGTKDTADFTFSGTSASFLASISANSGKLVAKEVLLATPKGYPRLARRRGARFDLLSWSQGQGVVESAAAGRRVVLPGEPPPLARAGGALDFLADDRQVVYASAGYQPALDACDWQGRPLWHTDDTALLPGTEIDDVTVVRLTLLSDGTLLLFQAGQDRSRSEAGQFFSVSRLSIDRGKVLASRIMYLPVVKGETRTINGGAAVQMADHELAVLNLDHEVGKTFEEETIVLDLGQPDWRPVARLTSPGDGIFMVYGAAVVGDRLLVGCGTGGAALLEMGARPAGAPKPPS